MNKINLSATVVSEIEFSHEVVGEKFYEFYVRTDRMSGKSDEFKCVASELYVNDVVLGNKLKIIGEIRTHSQVENGKNTLDIFVFVTNEPQVLEETDLYITNIGILEGYIVKKAPVRETPLGRTIIDLIVAVNRPYGKSDYIPVICWGRNAYRVQTFNVSDKIKLDGRLQSRKYQKVLEGGSTIEKTAYEFSVKTVEKIGEENNGEQDK